MLRLITLIEEPDSDLPETARATLQILVDLLRHFDERIAGLDAEIACKAREEETVRRLVTIPASVLSSPLRWRRSLRRPSTSIARATLRLG